VPASTGGPTASRCSHARPSPTTGGHPKPRNPCRLARRRSVGNGATSKSSPARRPEAEESPKQAPARDEAQVWWSGKGNTFGGWRPRLASPPSSSPRDARNGSAASILEGLSEAGVVNLHVPGEQVGHLGFAAVAGANQTASADAPPAARAIDAAFVAPSSPRDASSSSSPRGPSARFLGNAPLSPPSPITRGAAVGANGTPCVANTAGCNTEDAGLVAVDGGPHGDAGARFLGNVPILPSSPTTRGAAVGANETPCIANAVGANIEDAGLVVVDGGPHGDAGERFLGNVPIPLSSPTTRGAAIGANDTPCVANAAGDNTEDAGLVIVDGGPHGDAPNRLDSSPSAAASTASADAPGGQVGHGLDHTELVVDGLPIPIVLRMPSASDASPVPRPGGALNVGLGEVSTQ
jgi:hypothetical protein